MSSPFQRAFSSKSPLNEHKKIQRQINMLRKKPERAERKGLSSEGQGGIDFEKISQLEAKLADAKAAHNKNRTEEESSQVREDEDAAQGSAAEMRSPLNGSYTSPAGEPYVSHVGMIQQAAGAIQGALDSYMNESEANKAKRFLKFISILNQLGNDIINFFKMLSISIFSFVLSNIQKQSS